jgi:transposase
LVNSWLMRWRAMSGPDKVPAEQVLKNIRRATQRHLSAEDKMEGLRGEDSIAELYRREGIVQNLYIDPGPGTGLPHDVRSFNPTYLDRILGHSAPAVCVGAEGQGLDH